MWGEFEKVYAVTDYVDGIVAGVADFEGTPHIFVLEDEDAPSYRLTRVSSDVTSCLASSVDQWNPAPAIETMVRAEISLSKDGLLARGEFSPVGPASSTSPDLQVRWDRDGV
jgi:hypothetical protein